MGCPPTRTPTLPLLRLPLLAGAGAAARVRRPQASQLPVASLLLGVVALAIVGKAVGAPLHGARGTVKLDARRGRRLLLRLLPGGGGCALGRGASADPAAWCTCGCGSSRRLVCLAGAGADQHHGAAVVATKPATAAAKGGLAGQRRLFLAGQPMHRLGWADHKRRHLRLLLLLVVLHLVCLMEALVVELLALLVILLLHQAVLHVVVLLQPSSGMLLLRWWPWPYRHFHAAGLLSRVAVGSRRRPGGIAVAALYGATAPVGGDAVFVRAGAPPRRCRRRRR